jgi:hypothetical protein
LKKRTASSILVFRFVALNCALRLELARAVMDAENNHIVTLDAHGTRLGSIVDLLKN